MAPFIIPLQNKIEKILCWGVFLFQKQNRNTEKQKQILFSGLKMNFEKEKKCLCNILILSMWNRSPNKGIHPALLWILF